PDNDGIPHTDLPKRLNNDSSYRVARGRRKRRPRALRGRAKAQQARGVLAQDESLGLMAEIVTIAHRRHGPREDRIIVRKVGSEDDPVGADDIHDMRDVVLVGVERDEALTAEILARLPRNFWHHPPDLLV